ncbi:MAG: hypothetical protein JWO36_5451 [Myxococcales bacterium]|nr:hypothetical protein [Myxococcales bacterium]
MSIKEVEQALGTFLLDFMNLRAAPGEQLVYSLSSMQRFELLIFIEEEFKVVVDPPELEGATVGTLAKIIAEKA